MAREEAETSGAAIVEQLRSSVRGGVEAAGDPGYDAARSLWNGMIDRRPAAVARCTGVADVIAALGVARDHGLPVSVKGGGHNAAGNAVCADGIVLDLGLMNSVRVDPERGTVRVGGGAKLGDLDHETQSYGLAVPVGVVSETGIGGLALHGGMGFLMRRFGLTADNLLAADVVLADGRVVQVDGEHHPELLWALRGGGGNFGVVTSFEFQAYPVGPQIWLAIAMYPMARAADGLRHFRAISADAPDELMAIALLWNSPDSGELPSEARDQPVLVLAACWSGDFEDGEERIRPFRTFDTPILDLSGPYPYKTAQTLFDADYPRGRRYYWKSRFLDRLGDSAIDSIVALAERRPSKISSLDLWRLGGAMGRVAPAATPFAARDAEYLLGIEANWEDPGADAVNVAWAREVFKELGRHSTGGVYLNFPGFAEEGEAGLRVTYGENFERLRRAKAEYDPNNLFRSTFNIAPSPKGG